jgi:hypothetical protein
MAGTGSGLRRLPRTPYSGSSRRSPLRLGGCFAKPANGHTTGQVDAHNRNTDIDLQILDLLRVQSPQSAYRLASELPRRPGEQALGTHAVRKRLEALASRGLVAGSASAQAAAGKAETPALADPWRITEEGLAVVEPEAGVASVPYDREVVGGEEGGGRDAGFWVLIAIAVVTAVCAAYSLLVASGVLGGA